MPGCLGHAQGAVVTRADVTPGRSVHQPERAGDQARRQADFDAMPDFPTRLAEALAERYQVERELGQGGMAAVYLATDLKHGRRVALKVLRPELAATVGPARFFRE